MCNVLPILINYAIPQPFVHLAPFGVFIVRWRVYSKLQSGFDC